MSRAVQQALKVMPPDISRGSSLRAMSHAESRGHGATPQGTVSQPEASGQEQPAPTEDNDTTAIPQEGGSAPIPPAAEASPPEAENQPDEPATSLWQACRSLVKAYLQPDVPGEVLSLQPRCTLDQYLYTHLDTTREQDRDQVVLRYTTGVPGMEPKLIMVDQLWIWIINQG